MEINCPNPHLVFRHLNQQDLATLPFSTGVLPGGSEGQMKTSLEEDAQTKEPKRTKLQPYSQKHSVPVNSSDERTAKASRSGLRSIPKFAGEIRCGCEYGGVDVNM